MLKTHALATLFIASLITTHSYAMSPQAQALRSNIQDEIYLEYKNMVVRYFNESGWWFPSITPTGSILTLGNWLLSQQNNSQDEWLNDQAMLRICKKFVAHSINPNQVFSRLVPVSITSYLEPVFVKDFSETLLAKAIMANMPEVVSYLLKMHQEKKNSFNCFIDYKQNGYAALMLAQLSVNPRIIYCVNGYLISNSCIRAKI